VLAGYFDESGLDEKSQTFCIGGYVADSKDWFELTKAWEQLLVEAGVSCFHMAEFETRHGEFEGWSNAKRIGFIKDLIALVTKAIFSRGLTSDQQAEFHARAEKVYDELTSNGKWPRAFRLGSLRFASKRDAIPLQAADLLAYELRKRLDHKLFDPARAERRSMGRVRRRLINPKYFDEAGLRALVEEFDEE
jgi:hypothetical protein